jgi:alanine racemase
MQPSTQVTVEIDLDGVARNAEAIKRRTRTAVLAVIKADAYGLGASQVAGAVADLVDGFYVFQLDEAIDAELIRWPEKKVISLTGDASADVFCGACVRPVVWTAERAAALRAARPVVSVDTGQQRFAASAETADAVRIAADSDEAMTHAIRPEQVGQFLAITDQWPGITRHAAGSALLDDPDCWLDAVRPGLALYRDAVRVHTGLVDARDSTGPAGYGGFRVPRFGVILAGYSHGLRPGPCRVNGQTRRVIEAGMQTSFVEIGPADRIGDRVEWLTTGQNTDLPAVAVAWGVSQQEVLVRLTGAGIRQYHGSIHP